MTRRERLTAARERHVIEEPERHVESARHCDWCWDDWPCDSVLLLGLVDELAAALRIAAGDLEFMQSSGQVMFPVLPAARALLADLGPDA